MILVSDASCRGEYNRHVYHSFTDTSIEIVLVAHLRLMDALVKKLRPSAVSPDPAKKIRWDPTEIRTMIFRVTYPEVVTFVPRSVWELCYDSEEKYTSETGHRETMEEDTYDRFQFKNLESVGSRVAEVALST